MPDGNSYEPGANSSGRRSDSSLPTWDDVAEVQAILDRHGITRDAIEAHIDAEQAAIDDGTLVPLSSVRRAHTSVRDPN